MYWIVRTTGDPMSLAPSIAREVRWIPKWSHPRSG
jgi:hypothetical protein